jgi:N-acyl-L-homoserine lactone synthetase
MEIAIIDVSDKRIHQCFQLRYHVYCEEKHWLRTEDYPNLEETDDYDSQSIHIALFSENEIKAYCRLIMAKPLKMPIAEIIEPQYCKDNTMEISRFIVIDTELSLQWHVTMFEFISLWAVEHGIQQALASVEKPLLRILRMYGMDVSVLSTPKYYFGGLLFPILINAFDKLEEIE